MFIIILIYLCSACYSYCTFFADGEHEFLDLNDKLSKLAKYAPHLWKDDVSMLHQNVFQTDRKLNSTIIKLIYYHIQT